MKERRPLIAGIQSTPDKQSAEEAFVFGAKAKPSTPLTKTKPAANSEGQVGTKSREPVVNLEILPQITSRVPVTARCRPEVASALKRASLNRQLESVTPYHIQGIMEEALENWLRDGGYL